MTLPFADDQATLIIPTDDEPTLDVVRCWIHSGLAEVPVQPRLLIATVAEELVSNAREHGSSPYVLRLALRRTHRAVRVFVEDCGPDSGDAWQSRSGLALVDALSRGWGVEWRVRAKTVWAEVALPARASGLVIPPQPPPA